MAHVSYDFIVGNPNNTDTHIISLRGSCSYAPQALKNIGHQA